MSNPVTTRAARSQLSRRHFLGLSLGAGLVLAGCGGESAEEAASAPSPSGTFTAAYDGPRVELAYWNGFTGGDGPFMRGLVDQFNAEHDNIVIKNNTIQWADFYQKLPAAVPSGKGADVGVMHMDALAGNAARKILLPLDDVANALQLSESDFAVEVWKAGVYQGKRYGIPLDVHSLAMYHNTEHFEKAGVSESPTDAGAFDAALRALQEAGNDQPFWMPSKWPSHLMFLTLLWQNGGEPYSAEGDRATFDSQEGIAALTWQVDQIRKGYSPRNVAIDAQYVGFKNGKTSITWDGIWQINDLKAAKMPFRLSAVPTIGSTPAVWANSHNFFMTTQIKDENKMQAAKVFIDWMGNKSAEWGKSGMIPARKSVRESDEFKALPEQSTAAAQVDQMRFLPSVPGLGDVQRVTLEKAVDEATLLKKSPEDALRDAAEKATQMMQDNLKKYGG